MQQQTLWYPVQQLVWSASVYMGAQLYYSVGRASCECFAWLYSRTACDTLTGSQRVQEVNTMFTGVRWLHSPL